MTFLELQTARLFRFFSTRLLKKGYIRKSVQLEHIIFKLRGDEVAIRRIVKYGNDDFKKLMQ